MSNQAPLGDAANYYSQDDSPEYNGKPKFYGNQWYWGRELQHPGDSTPYNSAMIRALVQANAAMAEVMGWSAARSIHHKEHSPRKIDLSWPGDLRGEVSKALSSTTPSTPSGADTGVLDMDKKELKALITEVMVEQRQHLGNAVWDTKITPSKNWSFGMAVKKLLQKTTGDMKGQ